MTESEKRTRIIQVATAEVGNGETPANSNKTKYGQWYGLDAVPWCATFVSWVYNQAGVPLGKVDRDKGYQYCPSAYNFWKRTNQLVTVPQPGDIILFDFANKGSSDHTGIFVSMNADGKTFKSIEGNTSSSDAGSQSNGGVVAARSNRKLTQVMAFVSPFVLRDNAPVVTDPVELEKGMKSAAVSRLQKLFYDLGYEVVVDGEFGTQTEKLVKEFQKDHGLTATGKVTSSLLGVIEEALRKKPVAGSKLTTGAFLNKGDSGHVVLALQKALNKAGVKPQISEDGVFGDQTLTALKTFQQKNKLKVDGVAGPESLKALGVKF